MKTCGFVFVLMLAWSGLAFADGPRSAFEAGNYADAAKQLKSSIGVSAPSAEAYYNLGLAQEKAGDGAGAAANYGRALLLDPGLKPARNALSVLAAAQHITLPARSWRDDVTAFVHPQTGLWVGTVLFWIGAFGVIAAGRSGKRSAGLTASAVLILLIGGALATTGWLSDARLAVARPAVVVATAGADVLAAPASNSSVVVTLPAGSPVGVRSPRGSWCYVDTADGAKGWVQTDQIAPMIPGEVF